MKSLLNTDKTGWGRLSTILLPSGFFFLLLLLWQAVVNVGHIDKWILPSPAMIIKAFWEARNLVWLHSQQTLLETFWGFVIAVVAGIIIATLIDLSDFARKAVYPLLIVSQTVPIIALAPLFIIWFGFGTFPKVVVVSLVCFFPVAVNLVDGYKNVDKDMIHLMAAMGATKGQIFRKVKFPASMPFLFSGLRIAGTYSVMGAVIGEWLGATEGLGILMTRSSQSFLTDRVFAVIMVVTLLSLGIFAIIEILARVLMPWHYQREKPLSNT